MNKKCELYKEHPLCDYCIYYNFNGDSDGCYIDNGYCRKLKEPKEPFDSCKYFICEICNSKIKSKGK